MSITLWNTFLKRVVRGLTALRMSNPTLQILPTAGYLWNIYLPQYRREHCLCKNKQNRFFLIVTDSCGEKRLWSEFTHRIRIKQQIIQTLDLPVCILTLCSLEVNWSLTVKTWPLSISLDFGSFVRTRWVGFPQAKDCRARTSSLSGISVSCWISCTMRYNWEKLRSGVKQNDHHSLFLLNNNGKK